MSRVIAQDMLFNFLLAWAWAPGICLEEQRRRERSHADRRRCDSRCRAARAPSFVLGVGRAGRDTESVAMAARPTGRSTAW